MELLKVRADISIEDKQSKTALDLAMLDSAKHGKIIEALQVRGLKDIYDFDLKVMLIYSRKAAHHYRPLLQQFPHNQLKELQNN